MKDKRGQATIFIIIAIVIVAAIAFVIFIQRSREMPSDVRVIKSYLDSCFKEKAKETILSNAEQGFYNELPLASINFLGEKTAYYFKNSDSLVPTVTTVEQEFAAKMDKNLLPCLALPQFREEYDITWSTCVSTSKVKDESVDFTIDCPITISKGMTTSRLEDFKVNIVCNTKKLINTASLVVQEYKKKIGYVCISCFDEIAEENQVIITAVPITREVFEPEHVWFIIEDKDKEKQIDDKNLTLRFVTDLR